MKKKNSKKTPRKKALRALGHLEQEIMDLLWSRGPMNGKGVYNAIMHKRPIALTTVLTVLDRLVKKGLVAKQKGESVFIYRPQNTRDEFAKKLSSAFFKDILEISASSLTASFVDSFADTSPEELDMLVRLVEEKKKELKG